MYVSETLVVMADIIYQAPAVIPPTIKELADIASQAGIALADEQLKEYQGTRVILLIV